MLCYFIVTYFQKLNKKKHDVAVAAKKAADAKIARGGVSDDHAGSDSDNLGTALLR